ncbi:hypothetical protein AIZ13_25285, partial [Salmonella enterica subsp. enterica serovar Typhimurium]
ITEGLYKQLVLIIEKGSLWGSLKADQNDQKPKIDVGDHQQLYQRRQKHRVLDNKAKRANSNNEAKRLHHTYLAEEQRKQGSI